MNLSQKLTIELIRYELCGTLMDNITSIDDKILADIYSYAQEQDIVYIVASALSKLGLLSGDFKTVFFNEQLGAIYRQEQFKHDLEFISSIFEENSIAYIPLKGAVIKKYYPKPEMRTSCDIDILIHKEDLENALELLYANDCKYVSETSHDIMISTPAGTYLELHFTLNEYEFKADEILQNAWNYAQKGEGYRYDFKKEFFLFYHIAHIARHMYTGGCGLRPFVDLKIILDNFEYDEKKFLNLLEKAQLKTFYTAAIELVKGWFEDGTATKLSAELENYILSSDIYGNMENKIAVINEKNGDRKKYILEIIFPSKESMAKKYPILKKAPLLLPFMHIFRWFSSLCKGSYRSILKLFSISSNISKDKQQEIRSLLNNLDL